MDLTQPRLWIELNPLPALAGALPLSFVAFLIARGIIARLSVYLAKRTETDVDDSIVEYLRPNRVAWLTPPPVIYFAAGLAPHYQRLTERATLNLVL